MREGLLKVIRKMGLDTAETTDAEQALNTIATCNFDLVITDYKLPGLDGLTLLKEIKEKTPHTEVLVITAYGTIELAVEAMRHGAADFITKPFSPEELTIKVQRILERMSEKEELKRVSDENLYLREQVEVQFNYGAIVGNSKAMQDVYRMIEKVAPGESSVIVYGESGTGKELVAHALHKASPRKERAFVRVNCGALAEGVLESELFGHERGAFTGALKRKRGRFELADQGSIFLDEIGDIPLATQVKLLRVLQEREFERVGGEETLSVDVRIIAATNKNLKAEAQKGHFREDLYYRLHIIPIYLPPLREHMDDVPLLTDHFVQRIREQLNTPNLTIAEEAVRKLATYQWPGNIRELENVLERAAVLCDDGQIRPQDLPLSAAAEISNVAISNTSLELNRTLEKVEKSLLERAMNQARGNKTEAAKLLGVKTSALYYKLDKYDLL